MLIFSFLFGLAVGSFLNAAVFRVRWPSQGSLVRGRSHCPRCHTTLPWYDLIPLVSFAILGRRCRFCRKPISWQYPLVELATALLFTLALYFPATIELTSLTSLTSLFIRWFSISVLLFLFVFDLKYGLLPDHVTIPAIIIVFLGAVTTRSLGSPSGSLGMTVWDYSFSLLGAVMLGALFFAFQYFLSRGHWVGGGDIRMGALVGAIAGWPGVLVALGLSYLIGAVAAILLILAGKKKLRGDSLPMGPFLALGALTVIFFGDRIVEAVLYPYKFL